MIFLLKTADFWAERAEILAKVAIFG